MLRSLLDILFPPLCHVCKAFIPNAGELHICLSCKEAIRPVSSPHCTRCGLPFETDEGIDHLCGTCITHAPPFTLARAATIFEGPVQELVHLFKYSHRMQLRRPLALLTVQHLSSSILTLRPDLLIPVPLHHRRLRERGFNQALLLAETLSTKWKIPLSRHDLRRIRWTEPQIHLSATDRISNVRGAFAVSNQNKVAGKRVVLVDDVYTTGSTVGECAKTLLAAEAAEVIVVTVARARLS